MLLSLAKMWLLSIVLAFVVTSDASAVNFLLRPRKTNIDIGHHILSKRSFHTLGCLGDYDSAYFSRLERLCGDCYDLYKDIIVKDMCRSDCFSSDTFRKCAKALLINMEEENIEQMVNSLYGK